jgi:RNA polymerase sigma-B factor
MTQSGRIRKLTEDEIQDLLAAYARTRGVAIRDEIVLQYTNLVDSIARRFVGACEPVEDLVQEGFIGLITAVDLYDASKGVKFSTYATHFVIGQIKHYLRDKGKIIKEPAWLQELNQRMSKVIESLSQNHGRPPTEREIAEVMSLPEETVAELLTTREVFKVSSLDAGIEREDGSGYPLDPDKIRDQRCTTFQLPIEDKVVLETAMERLKSIEQRVIYEFFYLDLNQTEIARKLGISCNYVSHILRNSTRKLRKILMTDEIRDTQMQIAQLSKRVRDHARAVEQLTVVDTITGTYNHKYFLERLDEEISRAYRHKHSLSIVLAHIELPDSVGHLTKLVRWDDVLQQAAQRIRSSLRKADMIARLQDNVLAAILPHTGMRAAAVAERIQKALGGEAFQSPQTHESIYADVEVVWACYPAQGGSASELTKYALDALGIEEDSGSVRRAA